MLVGYKRSCCWWMMIMKGLLGKHVTISCISLFPLLVCIIFINTNAFVQYLHISYHWTNLDCFSNFICRCLARGTRTYPLSIEFQEPQAMPRVWFRPFLDRSSPVVAQVLGRGSPRLGLTLLQTYQMMVARTRRSRRVPPTRGRPFFFPTGMQRKFTLHA